MSSVGVRHSTAELLNLNPLTYSGLILRPSYNEGNVKTHTNDLPMRPACVIHPI